jgi:hypothetical protein
MASSTDEPPSIKPSDLVINTLLVADFATSLEKPTKTTPQTRRLDEEDPLIHLKLHNSDAARLFQGSKAAAAQLHTNEGLIPETVSHVTSQLQLFFRVHGGRIAPRICLDVAISENTKKAGEVMKVEFFTGLGQLVDFQ